MPNASSTQPHSSPGTRVSILLGFLAVALSAFFVMRLALLVRVWPEVSHSWSVLAETFGRGLLFDLAFYSYFAIPFTLYLLLIPNRVFRHPLHRWLVYGVSFALLYGLFFTETAEWLFWDEFGARFNFIAVDYLVYTTEVVNNIRESYPLPWLLSWIFIATLIVYLLMLRRPVATSLEADEPFRRRLVWALPILAAPFLVYASMNSSDREFSTNKYLNELAGNGPYEFIAAFRNNELDYRRFYALGDDEELSAILKEALSAPGMKTGGGLYDIRRQVTNSGPERRLNVILVSVESLSANLMSRFGEEQDLTPFLDRLANESLFFDNLYATGTRTTRGLESLTLSLPPTPGRSLVKRPDNAGIFSLGHLFQQRGYDTAFLYGGLGYFDNMNAFFSGNGYRIVDESDLSDEEITFSNAWGVADEDLYRRAIKEADQDYAQGKPFFFHVMTTSNHRPYTYPEGRIDIPSGSGRPGAVKYTDYALERLITEAKEKAWFEDTVFVVTADHCAGSAGKEALPVEHYHIPLFVYAPGLIKPALNRTLASQIDVAPTLAGLLNLSYESWFFGRDLLHNPPQEGRALVANYQKLGLFVEDRLAYLAPLQEQVLVENPQKSPLVNKHPEMDSLLREDMAFYQGADYILAHRMNRIQ